MYLIILWSFLLITVSFIPMFFFLELPLSTCLIFLKYYTQWRVLVLSVFLLLSGLPPVIFFFIKLNVIIYMLSIWDFSLSALVFCALFLNMLFYLRVFKHKSSWIYLHVLFKTGLFTDNVPTLNLSYRHLRLPLKLLHTNEAYTYEILYLVCGLISIFFFSIFFFSDLFLIIYNYVLN